MLQLSNLEQFPDIESAEILYSTQSKHFALVVNEKNGSLYGTTANSISQAKSKFTKKYGKGSDWK
jgi:hypothetical protein